MTSIPSSSKPRRQKQDPEELIRLAAHLHSATTNILLCLTKVLEENGALRAEDFEAIVRIMAQGKTGRKSPEMAALMLDFADQLSREDKPRN
jgi:hypothetical protein